MPVASLAMDMAAIGADPCRETVPVEIDFMQLDADFDGIVVGDPDSPNDHTHRPDAAALAMARDAFSSAPVDPVAGCPFPGYPTGTGVNLIVVVDDAVPDQERTDFAGLNGGVGPFTFEDIRGALFDGSLRRYFHYSLWIHESVNNYAGLCCRNLDFYVALGISPGLWTQTSVFMHELGHSLGLLHGGNERVNCKPNYLSIMNYAFGAGIYSDNDGDGRLDDINNDGVADPRFDYSRSSLPDLNETWLDETLGIGDGRDQTTWSSGVGTLRWGLGDTPLDWSGDDLDTNGVRDDDVGVAADLNQRSMPECGQDWNGNPAPTPGETLRGFDDWHGLRFYHGLNAPGRSSVLADHIEITLRDLELIREFWQQISVVETSVYFTDSEGNSLPVDDSGHPRVDVVLASGRVRSTNPGQVLVWIEAAVVQGSVASIEVSEILPPDWVVHPEWIPGRGAIHIFTVSSAGVTTEVTDPSFVVLTSGSRISVRVAIGDMPSVFGGQPLTVGDSLLVSVKLDYLPSDPKPDPATYPRSYEHLAEVTTYARVPFGGAVGAFDASASLRAYVKT